LKSKKVDDILYKFGKRKNNGNYIVASLPYCIYPQMTQIFTDWLKYLGDFSKICVHLRHLWTKRRKRGVKDIIPKPFLFPNADFNDFLVFYRKAGFLGCSTCRAYTDFLHVPMTIRKSKNSFCDLSFSRSVLDARCSVSLQETRWKRWKDCWNLTPDIMICWISWPNLMRVSPRRSTLGAARTLRGTTKSRRTLQNQFPAKNRHNTAAGMGGSLRSRLSLNYPSFQVWWSTTNPVPPWAWQKRGPQAVPLASSCWF